MDLQTGLIGLVIVVVLPVVVYLISVFGIKEKTYEEALAEQRQRDDGEWSSGTASSANKSSKDNKRIKRFGGRKTKEKSHGGTNEELHVDFKVDPEIIPDDDDDDDEVEESTAVAHVPKKKIEEPKSILMRKDKEKSPAVAAKSNQSTVSQVPAKNQLAKAANKESVGVHKSQSSVDKKEKTPPVADKKDKAPQNVDKKEKTPPVADKREKAPQVLDNKKDKTPPVVDKKEKTLQVQDNKKDKTPPVADKKDKTPPVVDKKEKTPPSADKKDKVLQNVDKKDKALQNVDKKEKTPPVADKKEKTPLTVDKKEKTPPASSDKKDKKTPSPPPPPLKRDENDKTRGEVKPSKEREVKQASSQIGQQQTVKPVVAATALVVEEAPKPIKEIKRVAQSVERVSQTVGRPKAAKRAKYDDDALTAQRMTTLLRSAVLSHTELQSLIELLLNRQQSNAASDSEWLRPGQRTDPLSALRKQLIERDESLTEERARSQAHVQKLRDVRLELQTEKSRAAQAERTSKEERQDLQAQVQKAIKTQEAKAKESVDVTKKLNDEIKRTRQALQQTEAKYDVATRESRSLKDSVRQLETNVAASAMNVERLGAENVQLQAQIAELQHIYEQKVADFDEKLFSFEQERTAALSELRAVQSRLNVSEGEQAALGQMLAEAQSRLNTSEGERAALGKMLAEAQAVVVAHESSEKNLDAMVMELRSEKVELEKQLAALNLQAQDERTTRSALDKELSSLREENEMLASQLSQLSERQEAEGHEGCGGDNTAPVSDKTNGHIEEHAEKNGEQTKILLLEHETILHEKEKLVDQLSHQIQDLSGFVSASKDEISRLMDEIDVQKTKNNALREKNWKAMDALSLAEKTSIDRVKTVEQTCAERLTESLRAEQNSTQEFLEKLFPAVRIDKSIVYDDWIQRFEQQAFANLEETKAEWTTKHASSLAEAKELRSRLTTAEENGARLEAEVQHFKTVLAETMGILNRLQSSVEAEESQWRDKLDAKEQEIEKLKDEKRVLMDKLEELNIAQQTVAEMGTKLELLKQDLHEAAESEKRLLESERDQARVLVEQVNAQLTDVKSQLDGLTGERDSLSERLQGLEIIGEELLQFKQTNRELNAEVVKLTGQLKVGVDALKAEQQLVLELRNKLEESQAPSNGPATEQIQITDDNESCSRSNAEMDSGLCAASPNTSSSRRSLLPNSTSTPSPGRGVGLRDDKSSKSSKAKNRQRVVSAKN